MNKKGEVGIGTIVVVFITIVVGVILFQTIAQQVGESTNTVSINKTLSTAVNGTAQYLTDYRSVSSVIVYNTTGGIVGSGNYTVVNNAIDPTTGSLSISITPDASAGYAGYVWKLAGTAEPVDYIGDSGGRTVATLIVVFFALAVLVVALYPTMKSGVFN